MSFQDHCGIGAAEAKGIRNYPANLTGPYPVGDDVEGELGLCEMDIRRQKFLAERETTEGGLDRTCGAESMAGHTLGAADGSVWAESEDGARFTRIVQRRAGSMGIDIVNTGGISIRGLKGTPHRRQWSPARGMWLRQVVGVRAAAISGDTEIGIVFLETKYRRAFAER